MEVVMVAARSVTSLKGQSGEHLVIERYTGGFRGAQRLLARKSEVLNVGSAESLA
jgi:hypothetical protein